MELKLQHGRYVPAAGGQPARVSGPEETAQRVTMKLTAHRGGFAPLPEYGSRLHTLLYTAKPLEYQTAAMQFIAEALAEEPDVTVMDVSVRPDGEALRIDVDFTVGDVGFQTTIGGTI